MLRSFYEQIPSPLQPVFRVAYEPVSKIRRRYARREFAAIKQDANGMLPVETYERLYRTASDLAHSNMVEIGAAHGAATISLARGMQDGGGGDGTLFAFEQGDLGSRVDFGTKEENIAKLRENIAAYGVTDLVNVIPERLTRDEDQPTNVLEAAPFSVLCLDADGNLARDFELFYDLLCPGAAIIIDDYGFERNYRKKTERHPQGGGKHYRTFCYVNHFIDQGLLHRYDLYQGALFAAKPPDPPSFSSGADGLKTVEAHLEHDRERWKSMTDGNSV